MLRTHLTGSSLASWLARLDLIDAPAARPALTDGLGRWLGWTDAIPLAAALQAPTHVVSSAGSSAGRGSGRSGSALKPVPETTSAAPMERELARVHAALRQAIEDDRDTQADADFPAHRRRCLALQQAMATDIGALRAQARLAVAQRSPALGRLAALDAVLGKSLGPREQALLAMMPTLLERHFDRLHQTAVATALAAAVATPDGPAPAGNPPAAAWLQVFRQDMKHLLLAELDLRLQPVQGLIEALRTP